MRLTDVATLAMTLAFDSTLKLSVIRMKAMRAEGRMLLNILRMHKAIFACWIVGRSPSAVQWGYKQGYGGLTITAGYIHII